MKLDALRDLLRRHRTARIALLDQALMSGGNFLAAILLVRALGLEEFGRFTIAWMAVLFAQSLQTAVVVRPMMSIGPRQDEADWPAYAGASAVQHLVLALLLAALFGLAASVLAWAAPSIGAGGQAVPLAAATLATLMHDFQRRLVFTRARPAAALGLDLARTLVLLAGLVLLWRAGGADGAAALWVHAGAGLAGALVGALHLRPIIWPGAVLVPVVLRHLRMGRWLAGGAVLEWTQGQLLTLIAAGVLGAAVAGAIRATQTIVGITHLLFEGLQNVIPIGAGRAWHEGGAAALVRYTKKAALACGGATLVILLVIVAAPGFWLTLFYGDRLAGFERLLHWHAATYLAMTPGLPLSAALNALETSHHIFVSQLAGSAFTLAAGWPIANAFGLDGVMAAGVFLQVLRQGVLLRGLGVELRRPREMRA